MNNAYDLPRLHAQRRYAVEFHERLDSTNNRALELARAGTLDRGRLILTDEQTAGRGRGENRWWASGGALTFSLLLPAELILPAADWPRLSLAMGLAVCETLENAAPRLLVGLKWPNDVYIGERKVCGILIEGALTPPAHLVVGMGVNVNNSLAEAPAELRAIATSLIDEIGVPVDRTELLLKILNRADRHCAQLATDADALQTLWQRYCLLTDRVVTVNTPPQPVTGRCLGIDSAGALLLQTEEGVVRCVSGTVAAWREMS